MEEIRTVDPYSESHFDLIEYYDTLRFEYSDVVSEYNSLLNEYSDLKSSYEELKDDYEELTIGYTNSKNDFKNLSTFFSVTLIIIFVSFAIFLYNITVNKKEV